MQKGVCLFLPICKRGTYARTNIYIRPYYLKSLFHSDGEMLSTYTHANALVSVSVMYADLTCKSIPGMACVCTWVFFFVVGWKSQTVCLAAKSYDKTNKCYKKYGHDFENPFSTKSPTSNSWTRRCSSDLELGFVTERTHWWAKSAPHARYIRHVRVGDMHAK